MKLTDQRIIEFFWKSPVKSFEAIRDTLRYLNGKWYWEDIEYELFNEALGDNPDDKVSIRVPHVKGIAANALFALTQHAKAFHLLRRRVREMRDVLAEPDEIVAFYELTPAGKEVLQLLEVVTQARKEI